MISVSQAAAEPDARRLQPRETAKILGDCRDLAIHRLVLSFSSLLDRVGDMLIERANKSIIRDETALYLAARRALQSERTELMAEFERRLRQNVDTRISGEAATKADFSKVDATKLTLIDTSVMDESVITGNIRRNVENFCHDELLVLNRGMGHLLGRADLETEANPLAPEVIVEAFAGALRGVRTEDRIKLTILRELNQSSLGDLNAIYADVNAHLVNLRVVPPMIRVASPGRGSAARAAARKEAAKSADQPGPEIDLMALFQQRYGPSTVPGWQQAPPAPKPWSGAGPGPMGSAAPPAGAAGGGAAPGMQAGGISGSGAGDPDAFNPFWMLGVSPPTDAPGPSLSAVEGLAPPAAPAAPAGPLDVHHPGMRIPPLPAIDVGAGPRYAPGSAPPRTYADGLRYLPAGPMAPTPSGYVPGTPIMATAELGESLSRLQAGETGFDLGGGTFVRFAGIPQGKHNVLRDLQESALGSRVNQLESMTIELVAMLFDFIFETRDLPDGIKALLARLQIPVLKAAMLDGAFFAKKSHPSRILVNALAQAGLGWAPAMGHEDPLYAKIHRHRPPDPRQLHRRPLDLRVAARRARGVPRRGGKGGRGQHPGHRRGDPRARPARDRARGREAADRAPDRDLSRAEFPGRVPAPALGGDAGAHLSRGGRGKRGLGPGYRHRRGPCLERAAEEDARGPQAPGCAAAVAAEAPDGRSAATAHGRARSATSSWRTWSRRTRRRSSPRSPPSRCRLKSWPSRRKPTPCRRRPPATKPPRRRRRRWRTAMTQAGPMPVGRRGPGHHRRPVLRDRAEPRARHVDRVRGR